MFTSNLTKLNSVPIIAYNSNVHFARNVPFSQTRSHIGARCHFASIGINRLSAKKMPKIKVHEDTCQYNYVDTLLAFNSGIPSCSSHYGPNVHIIIVRYSPYLISPQEFL